MKKILWLLFFYPCFVFGQSNALYSLLNWNTPEQQKGLIAWYDLQDPSVVQLVADQRVSMLQDKSIWKNHITQPTSTYQPLFISDSKLNTSGKVNGISFANGGYMMLKFPSTKTVQGITSFVICKNSLGGSKLLYDLGLEGGEGVASCYAGNDKIESRVPNSLAAFVPNFATNPDQYLFIATKGSEGNVQASLNDSQSGGQGARNFVGSQYNRIRLSTAPGDAPTDGTLYELILFDRELTHEEYWKVKNYLEAKYNIQRLSAIPQKIYQDQAVNIPNSTNVKTNLNPCNVNATNLTPNGGTKYSGGCVNGIAQGVGVLTFETGSTIKGIFKNNVLQDGIVEYKFSDDPALYIGPYKDRKLNGRFIRLDLSTGFVGVANFVDGNSVGNSSDYFNIPVPAQLAQEIFPIYQEFKEDKNYPLYWSYGDTYEIPKTFLKLFLIYKKLNNNGYARICLALYDYKNNKLIREYGSYNNPIDKFLCFAPDFKSFYVKQTKLKVSKNYRVELSTGLFNPVSKEEEQYIIEKSKSNLLPKSNIVVNKIRVDPFSSPRTNEITKFTTDGKVLTQLKFTKSYVSTYAINEIINQIALAEYVNDSVSVSLYTLDSLKFIKKLPAFKSTNPVGNLGFSPSGKYMYMSITNYMGTFIFKDGELYFGVPNKDILAFNNLENVTLSTDLFAYDLESRKTLWHLPNVSNNIESSSILMLDNDIILIPQSTGLSKVKPLITRLKFDNPDNSETFFSLNMKVQEELQAIKDRANNPVPIGRSDLIEGRENKSTSSVNSAAKSSSVNCTYRFTIPTIKWKFIDNRKVCAYCRKIYVPYTRNQDIESDKKINIAALMRSRLNDHFASSNASDEHIASDKARFTKFLVNNNFSLWGILGSEFQNAMGMMKELLIGDKNYGITDINLYSVENSDFCSYEHEDLYKRYRR